MKYIASPELEKLGKELVAKHHPHLKDLEIGYIFREEAPISATSPDVHMVFGMAISVDSRNWIFHRKDVIIQISQDVWEEMNLQFKQLLLDHELSHVGVMRDDETGEIVVDEDSGRPKIVMVRHDIEEFTSIMTRYSEIYPRWQKFGQDLIKNRMSAKQKKATKAATATP